MRMSRAVATCFFALAAALTAAACGGEEPAQVSPRSDFSLEQARQFRDFELYALGETYGELPLTAVLRRFDPAPEQPGVSANFVDFIYGTCEPPSDGGCAPPLSVQVWAACERNPMVYGPGAGQEPPIEIRGVPAYFYEGGRRLELSTGSSTVVIFASGRDAALAAAAALQGVNNSLPPGQPLPEPAYTRDEGGVVSVIPCAYEDPRQQIEQDSQTASLVERALEVELDAGAARNDNPQVRGVDCFRSPVPARSLALTDAHECMITWKDGSFVTWCVLSGEDEVLRGTVPAGCEEAAEGGSSFIQVVVPDSDAALRWGAHAQYACGPWREKESLAIGQLDQDVVVEDLSYVWFALRPYEAGMLRELRMIPGRVGPARRVVDLYQRRVDSIDAGLAAWQRGDRSAAFRYFDRAENVKGALTTYLSAVQADACMPP
jgi:hypothetical protein